MQPVTALSIAGSDSGGGAGIQADLRTFAAFGVHGTTALTSVTAQNTRGVTQLEALSADLVEAQIRAVVDDFTVLAVKTGLLASANIIERVAELAREGLLAHLVVDPVMIATSGDALLASGGVRAYRETLLPLAEVVTPNIPEAAALAGLDVEDLHDHDDLLALATNLRQLGPNFVLLKGGHALRGVTPDDAVDILVGPEGVTLFSAERVDTRNDHGTGCSLSAALCAGLALGRPVQEATRDAKTFVLAALLGAREWRLGDGRGPLDHLGWSE